MPKRARRKPQPLMTSKDYSECINLFGGLNQINNHTMMMSSDHVMMAGFKDVKNADKMVIRALQNIIPGEHEEVFKTEITAFLNMIDPKERRILFKIDHLIRMLKCIKVLGHNAEGYADLVHIGFFNGTDNCPLVIETENAIALIAPRVESKDPDLTSFEDD